MLHAPDYRKRYKADLSKDLPRIPFAPDFTAFRNAGVRLADYHLGYAHCRPWPVTFRPTGTGPEAWTLTARPMRWRDKDRRDSLQVTPPVALCDIPADAHRYLVNGHTPLEWVVDRLRIRIDKESGIVNDPNAWLADDPEALGLHLARLVTVSAESARIIRNLPPVLP